MHNFSREGVKRYSSYIFIVAVVLFVALVSMQIIYISRTTETVLQQFNTNVHGAATNLLNLLIPLLIITVILVLVLSFFMFYSHRQKVLSTMKMDFVNSMTHEMKTPIASISLASQMMNDPSVGNTVEKMQRFAGVITNESKRLNTLIEQLLYTLVLDRKKTVLTFENLDVNKMLGSVIDNFSVKVDAVGGKIVSQLNAQNAMAKVDDVHLTNVFYNLMENAVKYCKDVPLVITVTTFNAKDMLCISIEDNGLGMRREDTKRIFDKFYRATTDNVKGFGLGLAYVKQIIEAHNGTIRVNSELGVGSKFIIEIPNLKI